MIKVPIDITSAYRTLSHNTKVGGSKSSRHMLGDAIDFSAKGFTPLQLAKIAQKHGIKCIIKYPGFVHIDNRTEGYYAVVSGKTITRRTTFL